jgi:aquaporin Z
VIAALSNHWPEYLMEAFGLGVFMVSASGFGILLYHPDSALIRRVPCEMTRRILMGALMGLTAVALIYSPWGKRSGAHLNPAVTLTFYSLGKVAPWDAVFYVGAQFLGGAAGVALVALLARRKLSHEQVNFVATLPGMRGKLVAFAGEFVIAFLLMTAVLTATSTPGLAPFTGILAGICVMLFIVFEAPLSGMSMNPARTLASAVIPRLWRGLWIYFTAPPLAMLAAAGLFTLSHHPTACAKMQHNGGGRCIFCEYQNSKP